ncbi:hypothetical protein O4H26_13070 [Aequorivita viscosa]|nr:hypothetical protein [Aequorivita viscosa]
MKQLLLNNLKNIYGWKTKRKIVVISVDDYGNVRLDSKKARDKMDKSGLKIHSRFDVYDTLETREDLEGLYEVLTSVTDKNEKHAILTPFALPCNINFEAMASTDYQNYIYELLPETYKKLSSKDPLAYDGTWNLWNEGIKKGLMKPQFHGREHFNLKIFNEKLKNRDRDLLIALKNRSNIGLPYTTFKNLKYTAAFGFSEISELASLKEIAIDGVARFREIFSYGPSHFMAPTASVHDIVISALKPYGIIGYDSGIIHKEHQGDEKYLRSFNFTGKKNQSNQLVVVRNVIFEPSSESSDHINKAINQISAAFYWNKPAIISSHRVNYCGHLDEKNRKIGLGQLRILLKEIVNRWPDVEFMGVDELDALILDL